MCVRQREREREEERERKGGREEDRKREAEGRRERKRERERARAACFPTTLHREIARTAKRVFRVHLAFLPATPLLPVHTYVTTSSCRRTVPLSLSLSITVILSLVQRVIVLLSSSTSSPECRNVNRRQRLLKTLSPTRSTLFSLSLFRGSETHRCMSTTSTTTSTPITPHALLVFAYRRAGRRRSRIAWSL